MSRPPLHQLLLDMYPGEEARHEGEAPSHEVWEAQVDAFSARLAARLQEVVIEELRAALTATPTVICLHKGAAALGDAVEVLSQAARMLRLGVIVMDSQHQEEGGEA